MLSEIYTGITSAKFNTINAYLTENSVQLKETVTTLRGIVEYTIFNSRHELDISFNRLLVANDLSLYAKSILGDGNCFYRSISFLLLGTEEYFYIIKVCSIYN